MLGKQKGMLEECGWKSKGVKDLQKKIAFKILAKVLKTWSKLQAKGVDSKEVLNTFLGNVKICLRSYTERLDV